MQGCYLHLILTLAQGAEPEAVENPRSGMLLGGPRAALGLAGAFAKRTFAKRTPRWDLQERAYLMLLQSRARVAGKNAHTGSRGFESIPPSSVKIRT